MLRTVHLHGPFRAYHEGPIEITGETVAEVIEGITRQLPGFKPNPATGRQRITVAGVHTIEDLHRPLGDQTDIHIVPQMMGGKNSGLTQILLGGILLAIPGAGSIAAGKLATMMTQVGAMMILGGISQMLAPSPEDDRNGEERSKYLGTPANTTKIGTRIPILYGKYRWGGHYLAFDINAIEYKPSS